MAIFLLLYERLEDELRERGTADVLTELALADHGRLIGEELVILYRLFRLLLGCYSLINAQLLAQVLRQASVV